MAQPTKEECFDAIARSLVEFGYPDATASMVADTWAAMEAGSEIPHGVVGAFAHAQLKDEREFIASLPGGPQE